MANALIFRIESDTPIWWCCIDEDYIYNSGYLEKGISDIGGTIAPLTFDNKVDRDRAMEGKEKYVEPMNEKIY